MLFSALSAIALGIGIAATALDLKDLESPNNQPVRTEFQAQQAVPERHPASL